MRNCNENLITQLKQAFGQGDENQGELRVTTEVVTIDNHKSARVTEIRDLPSLDMLYIRHPESYSIRELVTLLRSRRGDGCLEAAYRLENAAVSAESDYGRLLDICLLARDWASRLNGARNGTIQGDLATAYVVGEISRL